MPHKILIIEDDQPILDLMDLLIRTLGYEPVLIANGPDALDYIRQESPSLILLDIMMMPMSGWEFLEKLRVEYGKREIPVIIFSASPLVDDTIAHLNDSRLGVLKKPVSLSELSEGIKKFLG